MRVFVTGATGFLGSKIVAELLASGHNVLGLTRSAAGAARLIEAGAEAHRGALEELDRLARGASVADAVIHTAFDHDFTRFEANCEQDYRVIATLGDALCGSARPLIVTSVTGLGKKHADALAEESVFDRSHPNPRRLTEFAAEDAIERGASVAVVRLPQVHDTRQQGLVTNAIALARETGVSAYVNDGANRWSAAPLGAVAQLYRLALEQHIPGARWHAVAEEGVPFRVIAETIAERFEVPVRSLSPEEAGSHFGWLARFVSADLSASSEWTRMQLGWVPRGPRLLDDLRAMRVGH